MLQETAEEHLDPAYLQLMFNQYFFADPYEREQDRHDWVNRVLHRQSTDYFPNPAALYHTLKPKHEAQ